MAIHDQYLRLTPLERFRPDPDFPDRHFEAIQAEIAKRGLSDSDPGAFAMLDAVGAAIDELRRPEDDMERSHQHSILLFHAMHMIRGNGIHELVSTDVARWAVEAGAGATDPVAHFREGARYLQLPQHLFWVREDESDTPLSLDGAFVYRIGDQVTVLGVMGMQGPGGGFSVLPLPPLPAQDAAMWRTEAMREEGDDFRSAMAGAELEGLYEIRTAGELLKLLARIERYALTAPDAGVDIAATANPEGSEGPSLSVPSVLPFTRWSLD